MSRVFLDSSDLVALWNRRDQWHETAVRAYDAIEPAARFITHTYVIAECANAFARSELRQRLTILGDDLAAQEALAFLTAADWSEAWEAFRDGHPGAPSLTDELSFTVMRRLGLRRAFTNDGHFADAGFEPLF